MAEGIDAKQCIVCKEGKNKDRGELNILKEKEIYIIISERNDRSRTWGNSYFY